MAKRRPKRKEAKPQAGNDWPKILAAFRERYDLTQKEAAAIAKVSVGSWTGWENGERQPNKGYAHLLTLAIADHDRKNKKR